MSLAYDPAENHPGVASVLRSYGRKDGRARLAIDRRDEMLADAVAKHGGDRDGGLAAYFTSALEIATSIDQIVDGLFEGGQGVDRVLDFGCGFGRVTRFLADRFLDPADPPGEPAAVQGTASSGTAKTTGSRLFASDVVPESLDFQAEHFGVETFLSASRPEDLKAPGEFDLIYVGSLFTHLPEETFFGWLERLVRLLSERGVLMFTVHDQVLMPPEHTMTPAGLYFEASSESLTLDPDEYGSAWVTEGFVRRQIERLEAQARGGFAARRIARGLCNYQDLYLVARRPQGELDSLRYDGGADVQVERCEIEKAGELHLSGWAISRFAGSPVEQIEVELDGRILCRTRSFDPRPDCFERLDEIGLSGERIAADGLDTRKLLHSGWQCRAPLSLPVSGSSAILVVRAKSRNNHRVVFAGTLHRALYLAAQENFKRQYDRAYQLEEVIQRMRQSRFWAIRTRWFALKRFLGLTGEH